MARFKYLVRKTFRLLGYELLKFNPLSSESAQLMLMLKSHNINTVIDVGANTGQFATMLFTSGFKGKVISFEPLPDAYTILKKQSRNNPNWFIAERCALGNKNYIAYLNVSGNSLSSSILPMLSKHLNAAPESKYVKRIKVKVVRLDDIIKKYVSIENQIFLKIDTQGYEDKVLEGGRNLLTRVIGLQLELSLVPLYKDQLLYDEMVLKIRKLGFDLFGIFPGFIDKTNGKLLQVDGIFFKEKV